MDISVKGGDNIKYLINIICSPNLDVGFVFIFVFSGFQKNVSMPVSVSR